ncbi:hypothetical protein NCPPB1935_02690 [Xanthomonas campestris pv. nigromaculans]|nr:hypothetical protein NCPPB1935_02690 [Xanthomonas campestris pv. nigromaculans]
MMSEVASFKPPDSPEYTNRAVRLVTPWVISWPATSTETSGVNVLPSPSPKVMQKQLSCQNALL